MTDNMIFGNTINNSRLYVYVIVISVISMMAGSASALNMEEAITIALENNHRIKQYTHLMKAEDESVAGRRSPFYPSLDLLYTYTQADTDDGDDWEDSSMARAGASYNLFNGFADFRRYLSAKAVAMAADYQRRTIVADVILDVKLAYIGVLRSQRALDVAGESVDLLERQVAEAQLFFNEGLFAKNDVLKVEVELSSSKQDLIQAEGDLTIARKSLERMMGSIFPDNEKIMDFEGLPKMDSLSFPTMSARMLEARSELNYLKSLKDSYHHQEAAVKGGYLPRVDYSVSQNWYGDSAAPDGRDETYDQETVAELTVSWNIFDGFGTWHGHKEIQQRIRAVESQIRDTEWALLLQLNEAIEGYSISLGRLEAAETSVTQAEENYRVTQNQFRQQVATSTDLLDAQFYLTRAKNQYNNALYDVHSWSERIERILENNPSFITKDKQE